MPRTLIAFAVFGLLALTVPWWWIGSASDSTGLPGWVVYALAMNVVFAVSVAWMLQRYWARFENDDDK